MSVRKLLLGLTQSWQSALHVAFILLCGRFLVAATRATAPDLWPVVVLSAGSIALGAWSSRAALFAFIVSLPLLNGLGKTFLSNCASPPSLVFAAMVLGLCLRQLASCVAGLRSKVEGQGVEGREQEAGGGYQGGGTSAQQNLGLRESSCPLPLTPCPLPAFIGLAADVLSTVVLLSLALQIFRHQGGVGFWTKFWGQPVFGYGDPMYFVTSAFVWLQGLFCFRMLMEEGESEVGRGILNAPQFEDQTDGGLGIIRPTDRFGLQQVTSRLTAWLRLGVKGDEQSPAGGGVSAWVGPAFLIYGITIGAFYLLQRILNVPDPYDSTRWCMPFEDIHSFGSFVVTLFIFAVVSWELKPRRGPADPQWSRDAPVADFASAATGASRLQVMNRWMRNIWIGTIFRAMCLVGLLVLVVLSWSRATWLAGALTLLLVAWFRLPRRWTAALVGLGVVAVAIINLNADRASWKQNIYLSRLTSLTRFEDLENKDPSRINLYRKALGLIREHPLVGHGIGSFYLTSVRFARPGDPYAETPNFAHNFLLQMAAELGVPVAGLFLALIAVALWRGYRRSGAGQTWMAAKRRQNAQEPDSIRPPASGLQPPSYETLGATLALTAYLITQLTANALNIYISNQFLFWFLMAAMLTARSEDDSGSERAA
ncbi:MAG: O-antigen ligase family protein [Opitutaceae bacterium]|nr:O-antigen ligase family protein [Opitutaceae bacterium]